MTFTLATALLGANSAGKTTLLRALCSLIPSEAHILIAGLSPADPAARRTVGLVNQRLLGHPNQTGWEQLQVHGTLHELRGEALTRRIDEVSRDFLHLTAFPHRRAGTYITGMLQRLHLARAVLPAPQLLMDEPSSGLDLAARAELEDFIRRARADGTTLLVTTHVPSDIHLCDDYLLLDRGTITAAGPVTPDTVPDLMAAALRTRHA